MVTIKYQSNDFLSYSDKSKLSRVWNSRCYMKYLFVEPWYHFWDPDIGRVKPVGDVGLSSLRSEYLQPSRRHQVVIKGLYTRNLIASCESCEDYECWIQLNGGGLCIIVRYVLSWIGSWNVCKLCVTRSWHHRWRSKSRSNIKIAITQSASLSYAVGTNIDVICGSRRHP